MQKKKPWAMTQGKDVFRGWKMFSLIRQPDERLSA
jgi:hypothetical protein